MEILGIVWAASILNQSSPATATVAMTGSESQYQHPAPIEGVASWFTSLAQAYGWAAFPLEPMAAHSRYVTATSWLAPELGGSGLIPEEDNSSGSQFSPLLPVIGSGLTGIETAFTAPLEELESEHAVTSNQWDSWDAVAAVRIVEAEQSELPDAPSPNFDTQCVVDSTGTHPAASASTSVPQKLQVWVHDHFIGEMTGHAAAEKLVTKLRLLIQEGQLEPAHLYPLFGSNFVGGSLHSEVLFVVDEAMRSHPEVPSAAIAVQWINNLRVALDEAPLDWVQVQMAMDGLRETSQVIYGSASWYGPGFHGRTTANGERFDENTLTAAHKTLPFNTHLKVTNRMNGRSVVVRINDRGPYIGNRTLDLSRAAADCLGSIGTGVIPYEAVFLEPVPKPNLDELTTAQLTVE